MAIFKSSKNKEAETIVCPGDTNCTGCQEFGKKLYSTEEGKNALRKRFMWPTSNCAFSLIKVCAKIVNNDIPAGVCDADIKDNIAQVGLIVDPEFQHQGIGILLAKRMEKLLKQNNVNEMLVEIDDDNLPAQNLALKNRAEPMYEKMLSDPNRGITEFRKKLKKNIFA